MSDNHHDQAHNEKFQRERIALYSDAVFAIASTLLIIEIKVPELHGQVISDTVLLNSLLRNIPKFIGFFVSFWVIGLYWMAHHRLFRYVVHSNQKLLTNNLWFLLPIVTMPFSTAFLSDYYFIGLHLPLAIYTINICFTGLFSYRLWKIVGDPKYGLSQAIDKVTLSYNKTRALTTPIVFVVLLLLSFISPYMLYILPPLMPIVTTIIKRYYKKKYPDFAM